MSIYADDVISFTSVLKMSYNFLTGNEYIRKRKQKERKKIISIALGFPDLAFAVGGIPVFPIRMERFKINTILSALNSATSVLGWELTSKALDLARQFDILKITDKLLDDVITSIINKYNEMYELGVQDGVPASLCYGVNTLYGMHKSKGKGVDTALNFAMRCAEWNQYSESLESFVPNQVWINLPPKEIKDEEKALNLMKENINVAISELESLTGNFVSDNSLEKQFRIGNQVKRFYKTILYEISTSEFYPCNPATFAEILSLLTITFQDYNSNAQRYLENLSLLVKEMRERIKKNIGMEVADMPRLLLSPTFSGWEPMVHEILYTLGGRTIYADWEIFGLLEEIDVSKNADPIENYAQFLLNASKKGIGCDTENLSNAYVKSAKDLNVDGIVFNQVFGCDTISQSY